MAYSWLCAKETISLWFLLPCYFTHWISYTSSSIFTAVFHTICFWQEGSFCLLNFSLSLRPGSNAVPALELYWNKTTEADVTLTMWLNFFTYLMTLKRFLMLRDTPQAEHHVCHVGGCKMVNEWFLPVWHNQTCTGRPWLIDPWPLEAPIFMAITVFLEENWQGENQIMTLKE